VSNLERRLTDAARLGFHTALVPHSAAADGRRGALPNITGIRPVPVGTLNDAVSFAMKPELSTEQPRRTALRAVPSDNGSNAAAR
jgi:hypothetical protein